MLAITQITISKAKLQKLSAQFFHDYFREVAPGLLILPPMVKTMDGNTDI